MSRRPLKTETIRITPEILALIAEIEEFKGAWFAGERTCEEAEALFDRHRALFGDKEDDEGIFPALLTDKAPEMVQETFNAFYGWIVHYDLISQWIAGEGPFSYEYDWLSMAHDRKTVKEWVARSFQRSFGVHPDKFEIV